MATLRIAIIQCGTLPPRARAKYKSYDDLFQKFLERAANRMSPPVVLNNTHFDARESGTYPVLEEIDAILITGSSSSSFGPEPWISELVTFIKSVLSQDRVRIIGVCFGHQITARALEGTEAVGRNRFGWELAVRDIDLTERGKEVFNREKLAIQQMHQDEVLFKPKDVEVLGSTPICAIQSMYSPRRLLTVQGHPEAEDDIVSELLYSRYQEGIISEDKFNDAVDKCKLKNNGEDIGDTFIKFLLE